VNVNPAGEARSKARTRSRRPALDEGKEVLTTRVGSQCCAPQTNYPAGDLRRVVPAGWFFDDQVVARIRSLGLADDGRSIVTHRTAEGLVAEGVAGLDLGDSRHYGYE
jgi:hypothetical protein